VVGREAMWNGGKILFARVLQSRSEKSFLLTGLRGVGKTVLLNEMAKLASLSKYHTILIEAHENKSLAAILVPQLRNLLFSLNRSANAGNKAKRALSVLKSFVNTIKIKVGDIEFGIGVDPELGSADSGDLEADLPYLFAAIGEAALEKKTAIAILIDEIQYFNMQEISALIMAMHKMQQQQLPLVLIGAGLPNLPALMGESKSYAERLFRFPIVGPLSKHDVALALQDPVKGGDVKFTQDALKEIYRLTQGYPYFVQEWGYQCWNHAKKTSITLKTVKEVTNIVTKHLDEDFFRVRFDRLTPTEKNYLRAMAELDDQCNRSGDIATALGGAASRFAQVRAHLIKKGMIYSPAYGDMAFTVPLFGEFMRRVMPTPN
jgi:hypothetical protein